MLQYETPKSKMITIVDYGVGNLASIKNMLKRIGVNAIVSSEESEILSAEKLILPGVGAFDTCAQRLQESGLVAVLNEKVINKKVPILGICVGMQLLTFGSEEGKLPGLGWINGNIIKFRQDMLANDFKIPHMGWADVQLSKPSSLFNEMTDTEPRFYFVHSYHPVVNQQEDIMAYAEYGYPFIAGIERDNILGVQFHPEKSHKFGMKLLENFVKNY